MNRNRRCSTGLLLQSSICLLLPSAAGQSVLRSFNGDKGLSLSTCNPSQTRCGRQPEMNVASNGKQLIQITWQNVNVYDYDGNQLRSTPISKFISDAGLEPMTPEGKGPYEPHVIFDEFIGRWIVTVTCANDCFLVSTSGDPMGTWHGVYPTCLQNGPCLNRDPALHIGYDRNGIYYCGGHLGDDHPKTVPKVAYDCFAIPSAEVRSIAEGKPPVHINRVHNMALDILPAIDHNPKKARNAPEFFAAKTCSRTEMGGCQRSTNFPFEWLVDTFTWDGPIGTYNASGEQTIKTDLGSQQNKWLYNLPCCGTIASMPQKGSDIALRAAESHRLINLLQVGLHLYGALGSGPCKQDCGPQGPDPNNLMFYVDLDCSKTTKCVVAQTAKITGPDVSPVFGSVGVDDAGNVGIVAESSTSTTDLSVVMWTHKRTDPPNSFDGPVTIVAGKQPYTCLNTNNLVPIANAVGILTLSDPLDRRKLWTTQQWSDDATPCVWNTRIVEYDLTGKPPSH
jgi:hypothetical protein